MIDRRELLRSLGAGAALAALAPLTALSGCGPSGSRAGPVTATPRAPVRMALREAVERMSERLERPTAYLLVRRRVRALVAAGQAEVADEQMTVVVLAGTTGGRRVERAFDEIDLARIASVSAELAAGARGPRRPRVALAAPLDRKAALALDPATLTARDWLDRARSIAARGEQMSSSRLIYRASYLACDDDRVWVVSEAGDRGQRLVRTRLGTSFIAWHGSEPMAGEAQFAGSVGPAPELLADAAIAVAAAEALALFTPTAPPTGPRTVLLAPTVVALVLERAIGIVLAGGGRPPAAALTIGDDPTARGYGSYGHDDDGAPAAATRLVEGGAVVGRLGAGNARRCGPTWRLVTAPSNLIVAPGPRPVAELEAGIEDGVIVTAPRGVDVDHAGVLVVRARASEVSKGRRTGRAWEDVELRASVHDLLAGVTGVAAERAALAIADDGPPRSVVAPWLVTQAVLGSARGAG